MFGKLKSAGLAVLMTLGFSSGAYAINGFVTGDVNLRAGPSTAYPVVITLPAGDPVDIYGCLSGYSWCDISWSGYRGWVSSLYLESLYESRRVAIVDVGPPIISFGFGYWDDYYYDRPFYRYRDRYFRRDYRRERRQDRREVRRERRQDRREVRRERRQDRQEVRRERRQDRREAQRPRRQDRQEVRRERRPNREQVRRERRQDARQVRRQESRQQQRRQVRQERRQDRRQGRQCRPGQNC